MSSSIFKDTISFDEALPSPAREEWMAAIREDLDSMAANNDWQLVDLPFDCKLITNKWALKIKHKTDDLLTNIRNFL